MFTEKEMSDALKWLFDLFQPEDYEAYDEEEVGCAALCLPEVCMALRDKAETAYEYSHERLWQINFPSDLPGRKC